MSSTVAISKTDINVNIVEENHATVTFATSPSIVLQLSPAVGPEGHNGIGIPVGGATRQRLVKKSDADYDTEWVDQGVSGLDKYVQFNDAGLLGSDSNFKYDKNTKTLRLGIEDDIALPNNPLAMVGAIDDYLQVSVRNTHEGTSASSDYVATADNGTDDAFYVDIGINSSVYQSDDDNTKANDSYLWANGGDLHIIVETPEKELKIEIGGGASTDQILAITTSGIVMQEGKTINNRPEIYYGTGNPPSAIGKADGTLFFKYTP
jgi:hypothetical protein